MPAQFGGNRNAGTNSGNSPAWSNLQKENNKIKKELETVQARIKELTPDTENVPKFDYQPITVQTPSPLAVSQQTPFTSQINSVSNRINNSSSNNDILKVRSMSGFSDAAGADVRPNQFGYQNDYQAARAQGFSDADVRNFLTNEYKGTVGPSMQKMLDDPYWGRLSDRPGSDVKPNQFGYLNDYKFARQQGYSDAQIRQFLSNYSGTIGPSMQVLLNDPNWGREDSTTKAKQTEQELDDPVSGFNEGFRAAQNVRLSENAQGFRPRKSKSTRFKGSSFGTSVFKINPTQGTSNASSGLNIGF